MASTSSSVASPNKRNPKRLVNTYTLEQRARDVLTTALICVLSSSSLSIVCTVKLPISQNRQGYVKYYISKEQKTLHLAREKNIDRPSISLHVHLNLICSKAGGYRCKRFSLQVNARIVQITKMSLSF